MAGTALGHNDISYKNCRNYSASFPALFKAINSDSNVEQVIHVCLEDFQNTAAPPRINTDPLVDFDSLKFAIQLASLYPLSTGEYYLYLKTYSLVLDT